MQKMDRILQWLARQLGTWLPPVGGAVYILLWIMAEAGRHSIIEKSVVFALLGLAIAVSGWKPIVSFGLLIVVPVLQLVGVLYPPMSTSWPMYEAAAFVALVVGFIGTGVVRRLVLPVGAITAVLYAYLMAMPTQQEGNWSSWVGNGGNLTSIVLFGGGIGGSALIGYWTDVLTLSIGGFLFYLALWTAGIAGRSLLREQRTSSVLRAAEVRLRDTDFELRLSQDRARISRDVHDALAHSLAVIVSQAEGAHALAKRRPAAAAESLHAIAAVGRTALVDVRGLVERIHDNDVSVANPTISDLDGLVEQLAGTGLDVTLRNLGTATALSSSHELAVFRIVQESLTNALKHAGTKARATATLDWRGPGVAVLVVSRGTPGDAPAGSPGVGIEGMKERARLAGGWLTAEPSEDGEFVVTAFIPSGGQAGVVANG